jgi:hypothetical protein
MNSGADTFENGSLEGRMAKATILGTTTYLYDAVSPMRELSESISHQTGAILRQASQGRLLRSSDFTPWLARHNPSAVTPYSHSAYHLCKKHRRSLMLIGARLRALREQKKPSQGEARAIHCSLAGREMPGVHRVRFAGGLGNTDDESFKT